MKLYNPDFYTLGQMVEQGYVRRFESPDGKLVGFSYTDKCTYDRHWNEHTLNARGTVYEKDTGRVVARAFPKFFNFEELVVSKQRALLKMKNFEVFWKEDGSLGIVYFYDGDWRINTRGSFNSDQAVEARKILEKYRYQHLDPGTTYLVEIIYPENRIIMDYGTERKLVMLAAIDTTTGAEMDHSALQMFGNRIGFPVVDYHGFDSIQDLIETQQHMGKLEEGYVVKFANGERVKFKSKEYMKLAAAMVYMTPLHFWKNMKGGKLDEEFLSQFPEEVRADADKIARELEHKYGKLQQDIKAAYEGAIRLQALYGLDDQGLKKYLGTHQEAFEHTNAIFCMLNGKEDRVDYYILRQIRPKANEL